jgi:hypothetical protein
MKNLIIASMLVFAVGCASSAVKVEKVETAMESKAQSFGETIGIDKQGQAIIQKEDPVENELREQRWKNADLENILRSSYENLGQCQENVADSRLGGNGEVPELPEVDAAADVSKIKETIGLNEQGNLVVVKKELLNDRIARERKYEQSLKHSVKIVQKHEKVCERKLANARVKSGLPAKKYMSEGHYASDGSWVQIRAAEHNLDDAFRFAAKGRVPLAAGEASKVDHE